MALLSSYLEQNPNAGGVTKIASAQSVKDGLGQKLSSAQLGQTPTNGLVHGIYGIYNPEDVVDGQTDYTLIAHSSTDDSSLYTQTAILPTGKILVRSGEPGAWGSWSDPQRGVYAMIDDAHGSRDLVLGGTEDFDLLLGSGYATIDISGRSGSSRTISVGAFSHVGLTSNTGDVTLTPGPAGRVIAYGPLVPSLDDAWPLGVPSNRWGVVYSTTGAIQTSDARQKTPISALTVDEINAAKQLSKEIGTYKFLSAVSEKGDAARKHIGLTVQRAIQIMEANNLNPFDYGFICYDNWEESSTTYHEVKEIRDKDGNIVREGKPAQTIVRQAGDIFSFRYDELLCFIAAGLEARLSALEAV